MLRPNVRSLSITSQESYSAVMIADVVADVPVDPETGPEKPKTSSKEETNLAYDGHLDAAPALENNTGSKTNGAGISKGVILNAVQFGAQDSKLDGKSIQLTAPISSPAIVPPVPEPKGFKDMSFSRKVAFGFSFVPSIMFVLCFAVILPCNVLRACVEEPWVATLNDTEATSRLEVGENIVFTVLKDGHDVLIQLDKDSGEYNEITLSATPSYLKCGKVMQEDKLDCIIFDKSGNISTIHNTSSAIIWNPVSETGGFLSPPVLLSGCKGKMEDVAIPVSNTNMLVLYGASRVSNFSISLCDSVPQKLTSWNRTGSSDILFVCDKDGKDRLVRVPKNVWCAFSKDSDEKMAVLKTGPSNSIVFEPFEESLVLWSEDEVSMVQPDGTQLWNVSNLSHSEDGRFILHGNFHGKGKQIALLSRKSEFKITLLDASDGSVVKSDTYENTEVTNVMTVQGKKKDFVLLLLKKTKDATLAFPKINDISTTIASIISNEELNAKTSIQVTEELAILDLDGSHKGKDLITVQEIKKLKDPINESSMTVTVDQKKGVVNAYILSKEYNTKMNTLEVRDINVANWDKSTRPKCL